MNNASSPTPPASSMLSSMKAGMSHIFNNLSDPAKMIATMNADFAAYIVYTILIVVVIFLTISIYSRMNLVESTTARMDSLYPNIDGKLKPIDLNRNDSQLGYTLKDYYIKTAYNACSGGQFRNSVVSVKNLINIIKQGVRGFDFEIYSLNDSPIVSTSVVDDNYYVKETYNYVGFAEVMSALQNFAFSNSTCPNPRDPIILHFRIKSTNQKMYTALGNILKKYSNLVLGPQYSFENTGQNLGNVKLLDLIGKIAIIVQKDNTAFMENSDFYEYVNMTSNSVFMRALKYYDVKFTPDMNELIEYNKLNMTFARPDTGSRPPNPSGILTRAMGCQMTGMCYQTRDQTLQEDTAFFDTCGYAFCLKPEKLRYIPVIIPDPKPPNPALSYAPRQTTKPYFSIKT